MLQPLQDNLLPHKQLVHAQIVTKNKFKAPGHARAHALSGGHSVHVKSFDHYSVTALEKRAKCTTIGAVVDELQL